MASSSFTPNLGLCNWAAGDKPKRADFVSDNGIIDTELGGHIANTTVHVTAAEKAKLQSPFTAVAYSGDGIASRAVNAGFQPKAAFVYMKGRPLSEYGGGIMIANGGMSYYGMGGSAGISINSSGITVLQENTATDGVRCNLNETDEQYVAILFK